MLGEDVEDAGPLRALIVEDQAMLAMELEMLLEEAGCDVVGCAMDRVSAYELAERERPDLALVDINLRDGSTGPLIAHKLVATYGCAVVFLTANPEQIPEGFSGALGAVCKPFDEKTIKDVVAFAGIFIRERRVARTPARFRLAPWLGAPPSDLAPQ
ncbi:response regulator [Brevundimonas balnearis]|uniref:Response regulator n=1 Tax=Brevundimonas balnearis TaxID=1572858 RepID=A0ABV6QZE8_9CAUL